MSWLSPIFILLAAFLAVFAQGAFQPVRRLLGAQVDLLPALMVYTSLHAGLSTVVMLACVGGFLLDSLSVNPLGISVLPLFLIGFAISLKRDLILREQPAAQFALGLGASALAPLGTLLLLFTGGYTPLVGWGTLWQWVVMSVAGALATPVWFAIFGLLNRLFAHAGSFPSSFRPDREIRRGRR
jgi:rod shape-determining protein MreD